MDRLHTMEVFAAVADTGSFAKAARALRSPRQRLRGPSRRWKSGSARAYS